MIRYLSIFALAIGIFACTSSAVEAATDAFRHVRGRILIDVEQRGEAWYVHPVSSKRYYLNTPEQAFLVMRELSLGITNDNLAKIPQKEADFDLPPSLNHVRGRILLQVENSGLAWYVHPETGQRHRLGSPYDALKVMTALGLGITHQNLEMIPATSFFSRSTYQSVPFTPQAPFAEWGDQRQQEGCEETAALMAVRWARGQSLSRYDARKQILAASHYLDRHLGFHEDTSINDTAEHILGGYFGHKKYEVQNNIGVADIARQLVAGRVVLVGAQGRALGNPNFPGSTPFRHMILVIGYDTERDEFITHDPGTRNGENYRYRSEVLQGALLDYPSGYRLPYDPNRTGLIAVYK